MAKILKTKKLNVYIYWLNCNMKPSDYTSAEEMQSIIREVRPVLADEISEFIEVNKKMQDIQRDFALEKITEKDANVVLNSLNNQVRKLELGIGDDKVTLEFDKSDFSNMFQLFSRVGKTWYNNTENYMEFLEDLNDTNKVADKVEKS